MARQQEVLRDMFRFGFIKENVYQAALKQPLRFKASKQSRDLSADYVAEIVRDQLYEQYQDEIYSSGIKVYTTIRKSNQEAANAAVREGVLDYDMRHGYRGPEKVLDLVGLSTEDRKIALESALDDLDVFNGLIPAVITNISPKEVYLHTKSGDDISVSGAGLSFVEKMLRDKDPAKRLLKTGAVVRITKSGDSWRIVQLPQVGLHW